MVTSVPNIIQMDKLADAFFAIEGNENKEVSDFYLFLATPSLDRNLFLRENTVRTSVSRQNNVVTEILVPL